MDDLIGRLVANSGDRTAAERAVGIIPQSLRREEPSLMPCADQAMPAPNPSSRSTLSTIGGLMGIGTESTTIVLSAESVVHFVKIMGATRGISGEDAVDGIVGAIPGLGQLVGR